MIEKYLGFEYWPKLIGKGYVAHLTCETYKAPSVTFADSKSEMKRKIKLFTQLFIK